MQRLRYVFIVYQKINHFINKYFGYVCKTANYKNKLFMRLYKELIALNIDLRQIHILVVLSGLSGLNIRISILCVYHMAYTNSMSVSTFNNQFDFLKIAQKLTIKFSLVRSVLSHIGKSPRKFKNIPDLPFWNNKLISDGNSKSINHGSRLIATLFD